MTEVTRIARFRPDGLFASARCGYNWSMGIGGHPGRRGAPGSVDQGFLVLTGVRLLSWRVADDELSIDLQGGDGEWRGYAGLDLIERSLVDGTSFLTLRAGMEGGIDADLLDHLAGWANDDALLDVNVEVDGPNLEAPGRSWTIADGEQVFSVTASST